MHLLKHYMPNIWQQHHVNAQKHPSVEARSQKNIYKYTTNFYPLQILFKGLNNIVDKNNPFLKSLPFDLNIYNASHRILVMML